VTMPSGEELGRVIYEQGPLTPEEVRALPELVQDDYDSVMASLINQLGPEEFVRQVQQGDLRERALRVWVQGQATVDTGMETIGLPGRLFSQGR
jgi:hypothetical protein